MAKSLTATNFHSNSVTNKDLGALFISPGLECIDFIEKSVISDQQEDGVIPNCEYYYQINETGLNKHSCLKCKFGYNGIIRTTVSGFKGYIQKCVEMNDINNKDAHNLDGNCDLSV